MTRTQVWMRTATLVTAIAAAGGGGLAYVSHQDTTPAVTTAVVSRSTIVETISATGTIEATNSVEVGSQVSGTVKELHADFNQFVHKGEVLARLDPSLFQTQVEQARASVIRAESDVERLRVALSEAQSTLNRSSTLAAKQLVSANDLETADVGVRLAASQLKSAEAGVTQARASLNQVQVNLDHTVITSPIDGVVLSRNVDVGQTVAASMSAPVLFKLVADLTHMRVSASLDESDVGNVSTGQPVTFRVDAYPSESFTGTVAQVRLQPVVSQNVVTYVTMIDCENPGAKLKPGMTASVTIEVARRADVLAVANAALRFKPTADVAAAFGVVPERAPGSGVRRTEGAPATGTLWVLESGSLAPVTVTTGLSDGTMTELVSGTVAVGATAVTSVSLATATSKATSTAVAPGTTRSPLSMNPGPPPR